VLDLGCGVGTAALCLCSRVSVESWGLELQEDYADLARRNADENNVNMQVITGDLTAMPPALRDASFDHARSGRDANRFILRARKGSKGAAKLHSPLILHEGTAHDRDRDDYSTDAKLILRDGEKLKF